MMVMGFDERGFNVCRCSACGWKTKAYAVPDLAWKKSIGHACQ